MTKRDRDLMNDLERMGYAFDRKNQKNACFFIHEATGCEVRVVQPVDERRSRVILAEAKQKIGLPTSENKRNPAQIRERNAAEHARAARELDAMREKRNGRKGSEAEIRAVEEAFLRAERKFRYWDKLMRSAA